MDEVAMLSHHFVYEVVMVFVILKKLIDCDLWEVEELGKRVAVYLFVHVPDAWRLLILRFVW
jgi:hypothetical protein